MSLKKMLCRFVAAAAIAVTPLVYLPQAHAEGEAVLKGLFSYKTLKADFTQEILDPQRNVQQQMRGRLVIQRPGKFRWNYQSPYEQEIVADGKKVWLYDVDLEQVTVKPQDQALTGSPASLLSTHAKLEDEFKIRIVQRNDGLQWFELTPKAKEGSFEQIFLGLKQKQLYRLEIRDSFGQQTDVQFENVQTNTSVSADTFAFTIPKGVDVIDETVKK
jgi:outer membrane lipoprotein carrier protein